MAFALPGAGDKFLMVMYFTDVDSQTTKKTAEIQFNASIALTLADAVTHANRMAAATGCRLDKFTITLEANDAVAAAAEAGSDIAHTAQLLLNLDVSGQGKTPIGVVPIPSPKEALRVGATGSDHLKLDTGDAAVLALLDSYVTDNIVTLADGQTALTLAGSNWVRGRQKIK